MDKKIGGWEVKPQDLVNLTPTKGRDLLIECFYTAQKETYRGAAISIRLPDTDADMRKTVVTAVKKAFQQSRGDFDNPTKQSLSRAVEILAQKVKSWVTPEEIIEHHKGEIQKILNSLT